MYNLRDFGHMLADPVRRRAHIEALRRTVRHDSVVLEIGTGAGFFALVAARLGAAKVIAIEPNEAIGLARQLVASNGLEDRIELIQEVSTAVELDQKFDLVLSDLRGTLPCFGSHFAAIADARQRFLAPGGVLIPGHDRLLGALVSAAEPFDKLVTGWSEAEHERDLELDLSHAYRMALNNWTRVHLPASACLTEPQSWGELDYYRIENEGCAGTLDWQIEQTGLCHGVALWFETQLVEGVGYSSAPGSERLYGQGFFPFPEVIELQSGDRVEISLAANPGQGDYVWRWQTQLTRASGAQQSFDQSTFLGRPLSSQRMRKRAPSYRPQRTQEAEVLAQVLQSMEGELSTNEIVAEVRRAFPDRFASDGEVLDLVRNYAELYG